MVIKYNIFLYQYLLIYYLTPAFGRLFGIFPLGQISLALLVMAFILKLKNMKIFYNRELAYSRHLIFLITILVIMILISMFISNDIGNSIYQGTRILLYIFMPFYFVAMMRHINFDKIIDLFVLIALIQVGFAFFEQIIHINIFDYAFSYIKESKESMLRFDVYRVNTSMGPLSLAFLFITVYPLTYYKNSMMYKLARYLIPVGTVMTVSITAISLLVVEMIILNLHQLSKLFSLVKLMIVTTITFSVLVYYGVIEKIITSVSTVILAVESVDASVDKETGINASSRLEGFKEMFNLMGEHILNPIGYGELYNDWNRYMPFNTDPGIPLIWGVELGVWAFVVYIAIFLTALKLLRKQKSIAISKYIIISLFAYLLMSFTTNHTDTLLIPFVLFGMIIKMNSTYLRAT